MDEALLAALMAAGDACEAATYRLDAAASTYLDPNVQAAVTTGMSRTFSENLKGLARAVREAAAAAKTRQRGALSAAAQVGAAFTSALAADVVARVFGAVETRGGVATEVYMSVLLCLKSARASGLLEAAKGMSLGCPSDGPRLAEADALALAAYHPLQAMCYAPSAPSEPAEAASLQGQTGGLLDLTLPQARLAVVYDPTPLLDRRRAQEFGPLASMVSGLSYKTVERLRTIRAAPIRPRPPGPAQASAGPIAEGPITVTTDGGATVRKLGPARYPAAAEAPWAPLAGAQPRVGAYGAATSASFWSAYAPTVRKGGTLDLRARYEAAVEDGARRVANAGPPRLSTSWRRSSKKLMTSAPRRPSGTSTRSLYPKPLGLRTTSRPPSPASETSSSRSARRLLTAPSRRFPYAVVEREARLSQAVHVLEQRRAASGSA